MKVGVQVEQKYKLRGFCCSSLTKKLNMILLSLVASSSRAGRKSRQERLGTSICGRAAQSTANSFSAAGLSVCNESGHAVAAKEIMTFLPTSFDLSIDRSVH